MSNARKRFVQKAKGDTDQVQIKPRDQAIRLGTATVTKVDLPQNNCDILLAEGVTIPKVRILHGYQPVVGETCKTILVHPVIYVTSPLTVPDAFVTVS